MANKIIIVKCACGKKQIEIKENRKTDKYCKKCLIDYKEIKEK